MALDTQNYTISSSLPSFSALPTFLQLSKATSTATWAYTGLAVVFGILALEQMVYRYWKRHLPGDKWKIPIIGRFADSMKPTLEGYMAQWASGPLSVVSVFHIFVVMASTNDLSRKILNSPNHASPALVNSAKEILMADNWVFLTGKVHVDYRRVLNTLFTRRALSLYMQIQDQITREHFTRWLAEAKEDPSAKPIMFPARELNMETSLRVFCGQHIPSHAAKEINEKYWMITKALELVNFPLALPGTKVYNAIQARKIAHKWLELAARKSKEAMAAGAEPQCMLDAWNKEMADPSYKGRKDFSDREMAMVVFSFLFASQDAMSSGLIYGFQHLSEYPEVYAKVKEEQERVRGGDRTKPITLEMMDNMPYLKAFVKESLRIKPPVTMVPYRATKPFPISADYTAPANSIVIPSFYNSLHDPEVFPEPDKLTPERWLDSESTANQNPKNYLVFGSGPHKCIGLDYAQINIALVLANAVALMEWEHERTLESDKVQIIATLFPKDGCRLKFTPRP